MPSLLPVSRSVQWPDTTGKATSPGRACRLACGRKGVVADFMKGLIKLAAAGVKALEARPR